MSLSGSAASILLHAFVLTTLLLAAATVSTTAFVPVVDHRDDVNTTMFTNGSSATSPDTENWDWEHYWCFLCTGRHPLLIHYCPIYWDECHLLCWDAPIPDAPAPPAPVPPSSVGSSAHPTPTVQGEDCYVMKLYPYGRYVIVQRLNCAYVGKYACFLTCGGGELADQKVAMGTTATTVPAIQGSFVPFELCNTQVNALRAPPSAGVVVPAGGAH